MILAGGGAVNFHGYQKPSAEADFCIDTQNDNILKLIHVFQVMGYGIEKFPEVVFNKMRNISLKFSPHNLALELITSFTINKTFNEAYKESEVDFIRGKKLLKWNVLAFKDLITSKTKSSRPKDILGFSTTKRT
jgi:hypothetical protein